MYNKVFISYASEDLETAKRLFDYLISQKYDPWLDKNKLLIGQDWDMEIRKALKESDFIILLLSNTSISKRGYIQREFKIALEYCELKLKSDIYILPCKIDNCEVPFELSKYHWIELSKEESFELINKALNVQRKEYLKKEKELVDKEINKLISKVIIKRNDEYVNQIPIQYFLNGNSWKSVDKYFEKEMDPGELIIECKAKIWFNNSIFGSSTVGIQYLGKSERIKYNILPGKTYEILINADRIYKITTSTYRTLFREIRTLIDSIPKVNDESTWPINIRITINEI